MRTLRRPESSLELYVRADVEGTPRAHLRDIRGMSVATNFSADECATMVLLRHAIGECIHFGPSLHPIRLQPMSYLFGDSTPSPFRIDFIEVLRLTIGFSAHVLRVEQRVFAEQSRRARIEEDTETDRRHLNQLLARLTDTVQQGSNDVRPRVAECIEKIQGDARTVVESGLQALDQSLAKDLAEIDETIKAERKSNLSALEKLLLFCGLPEAKETIHVRIAESGRYSAWIESVTPYELETVVELSIPAESIFAHDARVERFLDALEIRAPETAGWIRKESRMVPQKLGRLHIVEMVIGEESLIKLRSSPEAQSSGFDISLGPEEPQVKVVKIGRDADGSGPFDPEPDDIANLLRLREKLEEEARVLSTKRRALTSARLAGQRIEESAQMRSAIEQLVRVIAPKVREIAARSLSPDELVLRRMMGDGRREEIFVAKAALLANFESLDEHDRRLFDTLELNQPTLRAPSAKPRPALPPPLPTKRANRPPPPPVEQPAEHRD
jgi:hypothetical protein